MKLTRGRFRVLLHLENHNDSITLDDSESVSYELCQKGIAEAVNLSRSRCSEILGDLIEKGLLKENVRRVVGLKRRRKVYSLTTKGLEKAKKIREKLAKEKVFLKKESSEFEVELRNVDSYMNSQHGFITVLNKISDERVMDLTQEGEQKKEKFVGRNHERKFLLKKLNQLKNDGLQTILIKGKAGIGKTRLVNEFKRKVVSEGFEFLSGKGHYDSSEPYLPFKEAFKAYNKGDGNILGSLELLEGDTEAKNKNQNFKEIEHKRDLIFSKTLTNVKELAQNRPMVIFIDDLQWVDRATLMFFHYFSDRLDDVPILLIAALRDQIISQDDFVVEVLTRMRRENLFEELELGPLKWEDVKEIAQGLIGTIDVPNDFVQLVYDTSEGNPLFLKEIIRQMLDDGIVDPNNNEYPTKKRDIELPIVVGDIIERRIKRLNQKDLRVLRLGSVIGEEIQFSLLQSVIDMEPFNLLESADILTGTGVWEDEPEEDIFYFSHGLVRKFVYENIPNSLRKNLHNRVAKSMEKEFEDNLEKYYTDLGFHYKRTDEFLEGFEYYQKAGEEAEGVYAHEDALEMYKKALELVKKGNLGEKKRWKTFEKLGDVYKTLGNYEASLEHYKKIRHDKIKSKWTQRIYRKIACVYQRKGEFHKAIENVKKGLTKQCEENIEICRLLYRKGFAEMRQGKYEQAEKDFLKSLNIGENFDNDREHAELHQGLGTVYTYKGEYKEAINHLKTALERWESIGDIEGESSSLNYLGVVYLNKGDLDKALEYYEKSLELRRKVDDKKDISTSLNNLGTIYSKKGDVKKALNYYQRSHEIREEIGDKRGIAVSLLNIGGIYLKEGDLSLALKKHNECLEICEEIKFKRGTATGLANIGTIYLQRNNYDEAKEKYVRSLELCNEMGYKQLKPYVLNGLAEIYIQENDIEKALEKSKEAKKISKKIESREKEGISNRVLGMAYRAKEEWDKAKKKFEKGREILEDIGEKRELAELLFQYALLWKDMEEDKKKKDYMTKALSMFEEMGMELWIEKCKDELEE